MLELNITAVYSVALSVALFELLSVLFVSGIISPKNILATQFKHNVILVHGILQFTSHLSKL